MFKEQISDKQAISLIILFILSESSILVSGLELQQDFWFTYIPAFLLAIPLVLIFARIQANFPGKNLGEILEFCFGKFIGKLIIFLYIYYSLDLTALVLEDFGMFITIVDLNETPRIVPMIFYMVLCAWAVKQGKELLGRWVKFFLVILTLIIIITIILLMPKMDLANLKPILTHDISSIIKETYNVFIYPFGELIIFTYIFSNLKTKKSPYKIYLLGLSIGALLILILALTVILTIGPNIISTLLYPTYNVIRILSVADFIQRIEIIASIIFILGGFIKISIYLLATCKGVAKLFNCSDYRFIITPITLLIINLSFFEFENVLEFNRWVYEVWIYLAFIFIVIFPVITLILSEIKLKK